MFFTRYLYGRDEEVEPKRTFFEYVYDSLREQIVTGFYKHGSSLPSASRLSEIYHVGIRTVKDVLAALKRAGYIQTQERKAAVVIYRLPDHTAHTAVQSVLAQKQAILAVYDTMEQIMPPLLTFCTTQCSLIESGYGGRNRSRNRKNRYETWRAASVFLHELLQQAGNFLFHDLYTSLEIYAQAPFLLEPSYTVPLVMELEQDISLDWIMELQEKKDYLGICSRFGSLYHQVGKQIRKHLALWEQRVPAGAKEAGSAYHWVAERGRNHFYTQITRDLVSKMRTGIYPKESFLPPEAALAKQYGVSVSTVRKALSLLNELGVARTFNAKGTQIILGDNMATFRCVKNETYKRDTLLYLSGVQLMAILIRPAARTAFPRITPAALKKLEVKWKDQNVTFLNELLYCITDHLPLQPFQVILLEINKLLHGGYYFSFYSHGNRSFNQLTQESQAAFRLLQAGDPDGFAGQLSLCYCHILQEVREFIVKCGLQEAAKIKAPVW